MQKKETLVLDGVAGSNSGRGKLQADRQEPLAGEAPGTLRQIRNQKRDSGMLSHSGSQ